MSLNKIVYDLKTSILFALAGSIAFTELVLISIEQGDYDTPRIAGAILLAMILIAVWNLERKYRKYEKVEKNGRKEKA